MTHARRLALALAAAVILLAGRALSQRATGLALLSDEAYHDVLARAASTGRVDPANPVVIVRFDERTFQALKIPFSRIGPHLVELVRRLRDAAPRAVGFDMGLGFLDRGEDGGKFLDAVAGDVVFTTQIGTADAPLVPLADGVRQEAAARTLRTGFANLALPGLAAQESLNRGGVVRAIPLRARAHPSFALALACQALKLDPARVALDDHRVALGDRSVPLERGLLRFHDPGPGGFVTVGMEAVLKGAIPAAVFRDRVVLVGSMYQPLGDHHPSAFGRAFGVHLQAAAVHTLLGGRAFARVPFAAGLLVLAACLTVALADALIGRRAAYAAAALAPLAVHVTCLAAWSSGHLLAGAFALPAGPLAAVLLARFTPPAVTVHPEEDPVISVARASLGERFESPRLLGRGGMGVVLAAHDRERGCDVAVKIISPLLADQPVVIKRFLREIRALQELTHPAIVKILDVFEHARCPHYSMEIVTGTDLRRLLNAQGPLAAPRAEALFRQLFEVLAHVHDRGIVHRDLKPENLLVADGDELRLLDFGIAHVPEATAMTGEGQMLGTLRYMSPEQAQGLTLAPSSDVFSAGVVMFEALTGRLPAPEVRLADLRRDVDPRLASLVDACLAVDPARRPQSARNVLETWPTI